MSFHVEWRRSRGARHEGWALQRPARGARKRRQTRGARRKDSLGSRLRNGFAGERTSAGSGRRTGLSRGAHQREHEKLAECGMDGVLHGVLLSRERRELSCKRATRRRERLPWRCTDRESQRKGAAETYIRVASARQPGAGWASYGRRKALLRRPKDHPPARQAATERGQGTERQATRAANQRETSQKNERQGRLRRPRGPATSKSRSRSRHSRPGQTGRSEGQTRRGEQERGRLQAQAPGPR